jgi:hypothetical protein
MRIIYTDFDGKRRVKKFSSWREMCLWLKQVYPYLKLAEELGRLWRHLL